MMRDCNGLQQNSLSDGTGNSFKRNSERVAIIRGDGKRVMLSEIILPRIHSWGGERPVPVIDGRAVEFACV